MTDPIKHPYNVTRRLTHDGVDYLPGGDPVELTADQAALLCAGSDPAITPIEADTQAPANGADETQTPVDPDQRQAAIIAEIGKLPLDDDTLWTNSGKPDAGALSERLGFRVSAAERDAAWAQVEVK